MSLRNLFLALMVPLICAAASSRLMARAAPAAEDTCEKAIAQKVKEEKKPKKVVFASDARRTIPHGPLTHYAGQGSYVMPSGERTHFEWFCDVDDASGKPTNLHTTVLKTDTPAPVAAAAPSPPKENSEPVNKETRVSKCHMAVESELKKKNSPLPEIRFHSAKVSRASNSEDLVEGEGTFGNPDKEVQFSYRCAYNVDKERITAKSVRMK